MIRRELIKKITSVYPSLISVRRSSQLDVEKLEKESATAEVIDDEARLREEEIERKRNKSRLRTADRNVLLDKNPYPEPALWHHGTLKYLRRTYGRYGQSSGVDPLICWPVKEELDDVREYERVKYPYTIPEVVAEAKAKRKQKEEAIRVRQEEIAKKMEKLEGWKNEMYARIAKKESEALAAKARRERLIEEVKSHFGYTVDPRDDRFKEMLAKKEKEQKKAMKEERRKAKEEKMLAGLLKKKEDKKEDKKALETEVDKDNVE